MPERANRLMSEEASLNVGAINQRILGLEGNQRNLADGLSNLASRVETLFAGLATKIEERSRPQYPLLISLGLLGLAVVSSVGWLAYAPIRENQTDLKAGASEANKAIAALANQTAFQVNQINREMGRDYVSVRELDQRSGRTRSEIDRLNTDLNSLDASQRRAIEQGDLSLQRQIDDLKKFNTDLVSARDFIKNLDDRMRALEQRRQTP